MKPSCAAKICHVRPPRPCLPPPPNQPLTHHPAPAPWRAAACETWWATAPVRFHGQGLARSSLSSTHRPLRRLQHRQRHLLLPTCVAAGRGHRPADTSACAASAHRAPRCQVCKHHHATPYRAQSLASPVVVLAKGRSNPPPRRAHLLAACWCGRKRPGAGESSSRSPAQLARMLCRMPVIGSEMQLRTVLHVDGAQPRGAQMGVGRSSAGRPGLTVPCFPQGTSRCCCSGIVAAEPLLCGMGHV